MPIQEVIRLLLKLNNGSVVFLNRLGNLSTYYKVLAALLNEDVPTPQ
jgi:hypothetical protein